LPRSSLNSPSTLARPYISGDGSSCTLLSGAPLRKNPLSDSIWVTDNHDSCGPGTSQTVIDLELLESIRRVDGDGGLAVVQPSDDV
jgi:hypothetical protein